MNKLISSCTLRDLEDWIKTLPVHSKTFIYVDDFNSTIVATDNEGKEISKLNACRIFYKKNI